MLGNIGMKKIGFYIGVSINLLFLFMNSAIVISYLRSPTVSEAYSYRYVLIYHLFLLFLLSCLVIAIYFRAQWPNSLFKRLALIERIPRGSAPGCAVG
jgi:hypothetical protein